MDKKIITKYTWIKGVIINKVSKGAKIRNQKFSAKTCVVGTQRTISMRQIFLATKTCFH